MKTSGYSWDGLLLFRYINQIQMLGKADLNRMNSFSDKFQRSDARSIVKLFVAQGFLKEEKEEKKIGSNEDSGEMMIDIGFWSTLSFFENFRIHFRANSETFLLPFLKI